MKKALIALGLVIPVSFFAASVHAITISTSLPGTASSDPTSIAGWIANFYSFALMIGGVLAFGAIVYGGIRYALARGNSSGESEAKDWIRSALYGLLLLASAYIILRTVNPALVTLALPDLAPVATVTPVNACGGCPNGGTCSGGECIDANHNVFCGGTISGQCPSGQDCVNKGGFESQAQYSCEDSNPNDSNYTCGKPSDHAGTCPQNYACDNNGNSKDANGNPIPYYSCTYLGP